MRRDAATNCSVCQNIFIPLRYDPIYPTRHDTTFSTTAACLYYISQLQATACFDILDGDGLNGWIKYIIGETERGEKCGD